MHDSIGRYLTYGWAMCPIPHGQKGPTGIGWNKPENVIQAAWMHDEDTNIGLLHALTGTCALDIDDMFLARLWFSERGIDLDELLESPTAVGISSGTPNRAKLLFRVPFGIPLATKRVKEGNITVFELRCAALNGDSMQDVLPPSCHPSGRKYEWQIGWQADLASLPELPNELFLLWSSLIDAKAERNVPLGGDTVPTNAEEIDAALNSVDPDCDRETWIELGMAVKMALGDAGYPIWHNWSAKGTKFKPHEMNSQWKSFDNNKPGGITISTLFHHAFKAGFVRPVDLSMFKPVEAPPPEQVKFKVSPGARIPDLRPELWPERLLNRALEVAKEVGSDPAVSLVAGLAAISGAMHKEAVLKLNATWEAPPSIWLQIIGEPADKKSPASKPMFKVLKKLEAEDKGPHAARLLAWQAKEAKHAGQLKAFRDHHESGQALPNDAVPEVEPIPPMPEQLRLMIHDATSQKVVVMAENRPRGFLANLDEMAGWLAKLNNPRGTDDRSTWVHGYEGGRYTMDRIGSGSITVENFAMSIYGNCQPEIFRKHIANSSSDGLLQRFMPVVLNPDLNAMWQDAVPSFMSFEHEYENMIRQVFAMPPTEYRLSEDAMKLFKGFSQWALRLRENERLMRSSAVFNTALGKLEGNCGRIMLLFHGCENPNSTVISKETAWKAIEVIKTFFYPMMRYTYLVVCQQRDTLGQFLVDYVIQCSGIKDTLSMSDLRRATKTITGSESYDSRTDFNIRCVMEDLIVDGWVAYSQDHPRNPVFIINPELAVRYKEHRLRVIKAKQEIVWTMEHNMSERTGRKIELAYDALGWYEGMT